MILVISHEQDPHASAVIRHLEAAGRRVLLFNLSELPNRATLSMAYGRDGRPQIDFERNDGARFRLNDVTAVWWRRPQAPDLSAVTDPQINLFTSNEWNEAINGLWQLLSGARWMNDPLRDDAAGRKANQLRLATEIGLQIPRTLITTDPSRVPAFLEACQPAGAIFKTFSCTHSVWRETSRLSSHHLAQLDAVRIAPVIFQEFIPADCDLRITAVGGRLFPAAIRSKAGEGTIDFRLTVGEADVAPADLPRRVETHLLQLLDRLGLVYGAIDMRRTPGGEYYFFEVNTAGEFLFIEDRTGFPISKTMAEWLAGAPLVSSPCGC